MGKGGSSGGTTGSTHIGQLPWLFTGNSAGQPAVMGGLADLSQEEMNYLNQGTSSVNQLYGTGMNYLNEFGGGGYDEFIKDLGQETGLAGQYQGNINQANNLAQYGTQQMQGSYDQYQNYLNQIAQAQQGVTGAENQVTQLEQGTGLYPSQQAYVNQAVQSGQAAIQQQLAKEGLTSSTQNVMLQNQVAQSGAATAGQLTQGNIQLAQSGVELAQQNVAQAQANAQLAQNGIQLGQSLVTGEQQLSGANLQALNAMWQSAAQQGMGLSSQVFQQAAAGTGILGGFMNNISQNYGMELQGLKLQLDQEVAQAQLNAGLQQAEIQASSQGKSSMMGGLGSLMGKSQNSAGAGFLGNIGSGIGGLFGGAAGLGIGGTALGAGTAAAGSGAALAAGGTTAGLGASLGALAGGLAICWVAREVYGVDNPKWLEFRRWMLGHAPVSFIKLYVKHGPEFAAFIHHRPLWKRVVRAIMDFCLR